MKGSVGCVFINLFGFTTIFFISDGVTFLVIFTLGLKKIYVTDSKYTVPQHSTTLTNAWVDAESDVHQQWQDVVKTVEEHSRLPQPLKEIQQHSCKRI